MYQRTCLVRYRSPWLVSNSVKRVIAFARIARVSAYVPWTVAPTGMSIATRAWIPGSVVGVPLIQSANWVRPGTATAVAITARRAPRATDDFRRQPDAAAMVA